MKEPTREWIKKAEEDLESAYLLEAAGKNNTSCYHSQQSSEKYVKALLCELNLEIPKTHNIVRVLDILREEGLTVSQELRECGSAVSEFATIARYPGYDATPEDSINNLRGAERIKDFVKRELGKIAPTTNINSFTTKEEESP